MQKTLISASVLALGAAGVTAAEPVAQAAPKPWSVSAAVSGFYDDNVATRPSSYGGRKSNWGWVVTPSATFTKQWDQTALDAAYTYGYRYYVEDTFFGENADQTHDLRWDLNHQFSEHWRLRLKDSFVYSKEPNDIDGSVSTAPRSNDFAARNHVELSVLTQFTEDFGSELCFDSYYYNYRLPGSFDPGSRANLLNRLEHYPFFDLRYRLSDSVTGLLGYQLGCLDNYGQDSLFVNDPNGGFHPNTRDTYSHYVYAGADVALNSKLNLLGKLGVHSTTYDNIPNHGAEVIPYVNVSGAYKYRPGSSVSFGFKYDRASTDVIGLNYTDMTLDQTYFLAHGTLRHELCSKVTGLLSAQYHWSIFHDGSADGQMEHFYSLVAGAEYAVMPNVSLEAHYAFDKLDSDLSALQRGFDRNRVQAGVRATF